MFLGIGLEYMDSVFQTIKNSNFSQYTITGMKTLAILFFMINLLKKYHEGIAATDGQTWGLTPTELAKKRCRHYPSPIFHRGISCIGQHPCIY